MTLYDVGYNEKIIEYANERNTGGFHVGRIISEQKELYCVFTEAGEYDAEITGNLRYTAQNREDFPAAGDWVLVSILDSSFAIIHSVLPRYSMIKRRAPEQRGGIQIIATNIDYALIVQAADKDFNLNRIERYLTICSDSRIQSIIVITKIDLCEESHIRALQSVIQARLEKTPLVMLSNETGFGMDSLKKYIVKGKTYCLLGSSGVGKSTMLNKLFGEKIMTTGKTNSTTNKGKHTTSHRELVILEKGGILIDNPGMREVGMADADDCLDRAFSRIAELSLLCKFRNCTHYHEKGCAVLGALQDGKLDPEHYKNFLKMEKEKNHFEKTEAEKHKTDKDFGRMIKTYRKDKKMHKF